MKQLILVLLFIFSMGLHAQDLKTHKVQKNETIESIANLYLVTPFDIYALNPDARTEFQPNMVLVIPNSKVKNQEIPSETKQVIGFRTHKVKRKETLFSISQDYDIPIDEIKKHNRSLYSESLKRGDRIQLPRYKTIVNKVTYNNTLKTYTVEPSEGKWRVAFKFGITVPELESLNPNMKEVLQPGDVLYVPNIANNEENLTDDSFNYYEVQPAEGFYRLEIKLGLKQEELESLNPQLKELGLKPGMVLKIPRDGEDTLMDSNSNLVDLTNRLVNFKERKIAVLLPFQLHRIDVDSIGETKDLIKNNRMLNLTLDFHTGVLMALDSAKQHGISAKVDVFDTENKLTEVSRILQENDFSQYDAVVGPLTTKNLDRVIAETRRDSIPIIGPLSNPSKLYHNTFQTLPTDAYLSDLIINYVKKDSLKVKMVIIADQKHREKSNQLRSIFPSAKQLFSNLNKDDEDAYFITLEDLEEIFIPGRNIVFLETDNPAFASSVISILNGLPLEDIELVLTTSNKNRAFDSKDIDNNNLSNLKFQYANVNKYVSSDTNNGFISAYTKKYGVTPSKYAIRGFDLMLDVLFRLGSTEGSLYNAVDNGLETEYIENKFNYIRSVYGGYINQSAYIVRYENLEILKAE